MLGGSCGMNYMAYVRAHPGDFDSWAENGASGWSYAEVLPYSRKSEGLEPCAEIVIDLDAHNAAGPLGVSVRSPILQGARDFVQAAVAAGIPRGDFNGRDRGGAAGVAGRLRSVRLQRRPVRRIIHLDTDKFFDDAAQRLSSEATSVLILANPVLPRSEGEIVIESTDPLVHPQIRMNYFSDPHDLQAMTAVGRRAFDIAANWPGGHLGPLAGAACTRGEARVRGGCPQRRLDRRHGAALLHHGVSPDEHLPDGQCGGRAASRIGRGQTAGSSVALAAPHRLRLRRKRSVSSSVAMLASGKTSEIRPHAHSHAVCLAPAGRDAAVVARAGHANCPPAPAPRPGHTHSLSVAQAVTSAASPSTRQRASLLGLMSELPGGHILRTLGVKHGAAPKEH
jgi:hypothetical protein